MSEGRKGEGVDKEGRGEGRKRASSPLSHCLVRFVKLEERGGEKEAGAGAIPIVCLIL